MEPITEEQQNYLNYINSGVETQPTHDIVYVSNILNNQNSSYDQASLKFGSLVRNNSVLIDTGYKTINFADGSTMLIMKEWYDSYEMLRQPVIFRNSTIFKNYIYPLLSDESIQFINNMNECKDFNQIINEIMYYKLTLSPKQYLMLSKWSGFTQIFNKIKLYIEQENNKKMFCSFKKKKQLIEFRTNWTKYIKVLSLQYSIQDIDKFTMDAIIDLILNSDYYGIIRINFSNKNIIHEFVNWYNICVIDKKPREFIDTINNITLSTYNNSNEWISGQLNNLVVSNELKSKIMSIINNASIISTLNKQNK